MTDRNSLAAAAGPRHLRQGVRTASRVIDGKAVVITIDRNQLHVLNAVGTRVWQLLDGRALGEVIEVIVREFEVSAERASQDVAAFVEQLVALGAAEILAQQA